MADIPSSKGPAGQKPRILLGLFALYIIWGTPFLARRFALDTIPPLMTEGIRFLLAGLAVCFYAWLKLPERPSLRHWRSAAIIGAWLLLGGNGCVIWAQQAVASGVAALFIGMVPVWMVLVDWAWNGGPRPRNTVITGLVLGFSGIILLAGPENLKDTAQTPLRENALLIFSAFSWAAGSVYAKKASLPSSHLLSIGMQMLAGGVLLLLGSMLLGEPWRLDLGNISSKSALSVFYLILVASVIGYNLYIWLLKVAPAAQVSTYAYVNPVVAIFLGWHFAGEAVTFRILTAALIIIVAVAVIVSESPRLQKATKEPLDVP